jgi:FKBP-type peptidyl-prolyl cis-trans isomerase
MSRILFFTILSVFSLQSCIKQDTITYQAQLKSDTTWLGPFVRNNNSGAVKVNTGFWYSIDMLTNEIYPASSDEVAISYKVKLINSSSTNEADLDTVGHSKLTEELLTSAISGLQQGLILFPAGSYGRLYLPSGLAFGTSGHFDKAVDTSWVSVGPNASLLYEIKLIGVKSTRLASDIAAIDTYLQTKNIQAQQDGSGIRYTINSKGQTSPPTKPVKDDSVIVSYTENLCLLTVPDSAKLISKKKIAWKDQVTAWRIMLPQYVTQGSTINMYVPSGYGYGSSVKGNIPPNSNLVYMVTLDSVIHH